MAGFVTVHLWALLYCGYLTSCVYASDCPLLTDRERVASLWAGVRDPEDKRPVMDGCMASFTVFPAVPGLEQPPFKNYFCSWAGLQDIQMEGLSEGFPVGLSFTEYLRVWRDLTF